ncbi:MAG: hypothetical protein HC880_04075 [Bacteroidia bacterium]|nr:hypothetical protein [Bacteroidia bacterium]
MGLRLNSRSRRLKSGPQPQAASKFEMDDKMMLRLAQRLGGKLSVEDVVQQTSLSYQEAKRRLDKLHEQGLCMIDLDEIQDDGRIYYKF